MYSVVMWAVDSAAPDPATVESAAVAALAERRTCEITTGVRIVRVASGTDFVTVGESLQEVADAHPGVFSYALWVLPARAAMRTNLEHDEVCRREVTNA